MSKANDVSAAVKTAIDALALSGVTCTRRKIPVLPYGKDPPEAVVSIGEEGDTTYLDFEGNVIVRYPCAVTLVTGGGSATADDTTLRDWRESIRKEIDDPVTYSGVSGFHRVSSTGRAPFDTAALSKDFNFSVHVFTVEVLETRT